MKHYSYIIIGAGPSGLTLAHSLIDRGIKREKILILEKESVAGGLCRSEQVDGAPLDIGGGHFLDIRKKNVLEFLFRFMPREEWNTFDRISTIRLRGHSIHHPLEANLWQFDKSAQVDYLESIAQAGCVRGEPMPSSFADWITWKLGSRIAAEYMLPYNRKIWSMDPNSLGTYWLHKLPDVCFRDALRSCLEGKPYGELPAHGIFLYPKHFGYGEVWKRMGTALDGSLQCNTPIEIIDINTRTINGRWSADTIINTIPWTIWPAISAIPVEVCKDINSLENAGINVDYHPDTLDDPSHWIYEPDEKIAHHRLLLRANFYPQSRGHWTETNRKRSGPAAGWRNCNEYAYPINTIGKPEAVARILNWAEPRQIVGAGRWGKWEHMNSDIAVAEALALASQLTAN